MVRLIAEVHGKRIKLVKIFNPILSLMISRVGIINKVFGNLVYEKSMSSYDKAEYKIKDFKGSIRAAENGDGVNG